VLGLAADVGVVELQKKLSFAHVVALLNQEALDDGGDGGVSFEIEIVQRLNFAVGGDQAADGTALDGGDVHGERRAAGEDGDEDYGSNDSGGKPGVAAPARGVSIRIVVVRCQILFVSSLLNTGRLRQPVFFQGRAGTIASSNLPPRRLGEEPRTPLAAVLV
jgi:hypothetical protein